jgi:signal transduction histidine kinase
MACVMLAVVALVSCVDAWLAGRRAHGQVETQLQEIGRTLAGASFPLTDNVLRQMRGLSGAEFVVANQAGTVVASSLDQVPAEPLPGPKQAGEREPLALQRRVPIAGETYLHSQLEISRPFRGRDPDVLHVLYPERRYRQAWREAVVPPAATGLAALVIVVVISGAIAARVTRPLHRLSAQVEGIARGDFTPLPISPRDDELRDLALAINRTAEMLTRYEQQVRRHEKLRTLGRLGGGIAHQLRNSVTGCRLALDLHALDCSRGADEGLAVARQQLDLMEEYLQRFLSLGKQETRPPVLLNLADVVDRTLTLVRPKAQHLGVELQWSRPADPLPIAGDADQIVQAVVNLLLNAIEAAAATGATHFAGRVPPRVAVTLLTDQASGNVRLDVLDTGAGPAEHVCDQIYEPLVSEKPDGVGLGLSIAREVIEQHGGTLNWRRRDDLTCFTIELPKGNAENLHVETAGCG